MGTEPGRPWAVASRLDEALQYGYLGVAGADPPDHQLEQILSIAVGCQLLIPVISSVFALNARLGRHLGPGDADGEERSHYRDSCHSGAGRRALFAELVLGLLLRGATLLARSEVAELHVPNLVGQSCAQFVRRQHSESLLRDAKSELALSVRSCGQIDGAAG